MAVEAIGGARTEVVPGIPSRLPALAAEAFGTFVLVLSGTATLLATDLGGPYSHLIFAILIAAVAIITRQPFWLSVVVLINVEILR
jgi:glycerol uptake facilitator-like aquaporin